MKTWYKSDLIPCEKWHGLLDKMPTRCQEFVTEMDKNPDCMGLGYNDKIGWFIAGSIGGADGIYYQEKTYPTEEVNNGSYQDSTSEEYCH